MDDSVQEHQGHQGFHIAHWCLRAANRMAAVIAILVVVFLALDQRFVLLRHQPGGEAFDLNEQPILMVLFGIGALSALRWRLIGGAIAAFTAAGLIVFARQQLQPFDASLVIAGFALPAALWLAVGVFERRDERFHRAPDEPSRPLLYRRDVLGGLGLLAATSIAGVRVGQWVFGRVYGPTHPESQVAPVTDSLTRWVWSGAVTASSAEVNARLTNAELQSVALLVGPSADLSESQRVAAVADDFEVVRVPLDGLEPATRYHYAFEVDGQVDERRTGSFMTSPAGAASFGIAFGSCSRTQSNGAVWDAIRALDPHMFVITGDIHYADITTNDPPRFRAVMDLQLSRPAQTALFRQMPVAYTWDDHDWGGPDRFAGGADAARETYRRYVPHYPLASDTSPVYQAFSVGRVRFVLTDIRSGREPAVDGRQGTMLGAEQKAWLKDELRTAGADHALTVWVNPVPWISAEAGGDDWNGFPEERREIADFVASNGLADRLCMVSGDAHMIALDDGTNSDYSSAGGAGFPVLHAAALDRPGSLKGGPYSHGAFPGSGQFGHLDVIDDGERLDIVLTGRTWENEILVTLEWSLETP